MTRYGIATINQAMPPKPKFSTDQIPDLTGKVVIVTGGNAGVGKETIKALLEHNAKVYMASRSFDKAKAAIEDLKAATGKEALFLQLDLSSLSAVRKSAEEFLSKEKELHILFNNAGVMRPPIDQLSEDGYDLQWGTNVIGHFFFTYLLLPALTAGARSSPDSYSRVVHTSSSAAYACGIDWDTLRDGKKRRSTGDQMLYGQSKLGNAIVAHEFAKRYSDQGVLSYSCNPGNLSTDLYQWASPRVRNFLNTYILYPVSYGALTQLWAGTMPETIQYNGEFLIPWARKGRCRDEVYDPVVGEKLWNYLLEQVKDK
ncbi:NAD-P-binding protein [Abortiporus biennis]|nr:NAD-P-binding protein [Abortiporus biennis]